MSRLSGFLALLCLTVAITARPVAAEEITVTVPLDTPAEAAVEPAQAPVAEHVEHSEPKAEPQPESAAARVPVAEESSGVAEQPAAVATPAVEAPSEEAPAVKAPAAAVEAPAPQPKAAAKARPAKAKQAAATCKGLDETACGQNKRCIWVVGATATEASANAKGDVKARCRSTAVLKKEAKGFSKAHKGEVLPWAPVADTPSVTGGAGAPVTGTSAAGSATTKAKSAAVNKAPHDAAPVAPAAQ